MDKTVCFFLCFFLCLLVCVTRIVLIPVCRRCCERSIKSRPWLAITRQSLSTISGEGAIPDQIVSRSTPAKALASSLLYSSVNEPHNNKGFLEFCLSVDCPRRAVQLIRSNFKMNDSDMYEGVRARE